MPTVRLEEDVNFHTCSPGCKGIDSVDPYPLLEHLLTCGFLTHPFFIHLVQMKNGGGATNLTIFTELVHIFVNDESRPLRTVISDLQYAGYINYSLIIKHIYDNNANGMRSMPRINVDQLGQRRFLTHFYKLLKDFHNNPNSTFNERLLKFHKFKYQIAIAIRREKDPVMQMYLVDKQVALYAAYIDFLTIKYKPDLYSYTIFDKLNKIIARRTAGPSCILIPQIVFCQRKAIACAIAGNFGTGEELISAMDNMVCHLGTMCRELGNISYFKMYFKLWKFEAYPSNDLQNDILLEGERGLAQDGLCSIDSRQFWIAPILIKMIYCLIGLGNKGNVIKGFIVYSKNIDRAENMLLRHFSKSGLSIRRKMQLLVARARICELRSQWGTANLHIKEAHVLSRKGCYEEESVIAEYVSLLNKIGNDDLATTTFPDLHSENSSMYEVEDLVENTDNFQHIITEKEGFAVDLSDSELAMSSKGHVAPSLQFTSLLYDDKSDLFANKSFQETSKRDVTQSITFPDLYSENSSICAVEDLVENIDNRHVILTEKEGIAVDVFDTELAMSSKVNIASSLQFSSLLLDDQSDLMVSKSFKETSKCDDAQTEQNLETKFSAEVTEVNIHDSHSNITSISNIRPTCYSVGEDEDRHYSKDRNNHANNNNAKADLGNNKVSTNEGFRNGHKERDKSTTMQNWIQWTIICPIFSHLVVVFSMINSSPIAALCLGAQP